MAKKTSSTSIFFYLLALTVFFLLLEVSFFIQCNQSYFADFTLVTDKLNIPATILPGIAHFLIAQIIVHFIYCLIIWVITLLIANLLRIPENKKIDLGIGIWLLGILTVLVANQCFFPNSKFSELTSLILFSSKLANIFFIFLLLICINVLLIATLSFFNFINKSALKPFKFHFLTAFIGIFFLLESPLLIPQDAATEEKPNIIMVGVDSLRPDFLSFFGYENLTPFFDSFLEQATIFSDTVTPLARTFPSWASILSGQYPRELGIRTNLAQQNKVNLTNTLPSLLRKLGYETIFATDETRFSNIDKNFGFDEIIGPPMGLNDFLVGTLNDFPLSNLIINTKVGYWLFPYSYANRPVYFTYDPNSFLELMRPTLQKTRTKPLFLTVHFCLPHFPYIWGGWAANNSYVRERYEASIKRVDKQVRDFFVLLKKNQLLNHSIVVLLSDHGEALELPGDRITEQEGFLFPNEQKKSIPKFYPPSLDDEKLNQSAGHGTDVLGLSQYHSLLAFRMYGFGKQKNGVYPGIISLLDVKPTILDLIGLTAIDLQHSAYKGKSLAKTIRGEASHISPPAHIFIESDFSPESIRTVYPEARKVLLEGVDLFQIDPVSTRLTVKDEMDKMIIKSKQYADIYGDWMLALYPQNQHYRMPILINLTDGKWTNDLNSPFAKQSPAMEMLKALKAFYGDEIINIQLTPHSNCSQRTFS